MKIYLCAKVHQWNHPVMLSKLSDRCPGCGQPLALHKAMDDAK